MQKRYMIVTLNEEDGSRESGNVYYCSQVLLSTTRDELQFDGPLFEENMDYVESDAEGPVDLFCKQAVTLGYVVENATTKVVNYETSYS